MPSPAPCGALPKPTRLGKYDGDQDQLMLALRLMSEAFGGVSKLARSARLNANTVYHTFVERDPELTSLRAVLRAPIRSPCLSQAGHGNFHTIEAELMLYEFNHDRPSHRDL
jgi:hypothetical protein